MRFKLILAFLLFMPTVTFAALVPCDGPKCGVCDFVQLGQNILDFLVTIGVIIAAIAFAVAGFYLVASAGDTQKVSKAKGLFTNAVIGLIILLASWLIIDTLMKMLVKEGALDMGGLDCSISTSSGAGGQEQEGGGTGSGSNNGGEDDGGSDNGGGIIVTGNDNDALDHDTVQGLFQDENIEVTSTNGPQNVFADCNGDGCTSLDGLRADLALEAIEIKRACNCNMTISGGTEALAHGGGEFSHGNGYKLDFDRNASSGVLDTYFANTYGQTEGRTYKTTFNSNDTYSFTKENSVITVIDEGSHWDVQVKPLETST